MPRPLNAVWNWLTTWPRPRWSWRATVPSLQPARLRLVRIIDAELDTAELRNDGGGSALDIDVRVTHLSADPADHTDHVPGDDPGQAWRGALPNLGPRTRYIIDLVDLGPGVTALDAPPGVWARVAWRNADGSTDEAWARADDATSLFVEQAPPGG